MAGRKRKPQGLSIKAAIAALERAGFQPRIAEGFPMIPGAPDLYDCEGLGRDLTEGQLIQLAHRRGAWRPAFEGAHSAGPGGLGSPSD